MSLRWCVHDSDGASSAVRRVSALGFRRLEVCGLTETEADDWSRIAAEADVEAVSVHAPCPDDVQNDRRTPGDWLLDPDPDLRAAALAAALGTIRFARTIGVRHVVFHLGTLDLQALYRELATAATVSTGEPQRAAYRSARDRAFAQVERHLIEAVEALLDAAAGDVQVCVENRYRFDQVPNVEDSARLLARFPAESGLAYWHDTGHEAAQRYLGLWHDGAFGRVSDRLAGMHLHDCAGTDDHRPPGEGNYPFSSLTRLVRPGMPLVLELDPAADGERVCAGERYAAERLELTRPNTSSAQPPRR
jgi:sugar phosphate isomerase/epimerase